MTNPGTKLTPASRIIGYVKHVPEHLVFKKMGVMI